MTGYDLIRLILNKISFSCNMVWIKWDMGHQYLLESNYSCLWKHVENNLFLSNFMKISSPSLNIFYNLFYFRGFLPTLSSSLEYLFFTWNLSIFTPYLAVFSHWIYSTPLWQNLLTFRSTIVFLLFYMCVVCIFNIFNLQLNCVFSCT